jgi:hypothetical protein
MRGLCLLNWVAPARLKLCPWQRKSNGSGAAKVDDPNPRPMSCGPEPDWTPHVFSNDPALRSVLDQASSS